MSGLWVWLGGRLVPAEDAHVSVADRGFLAGDGVFEALKAIGGVPFALRRHVDRLERSCAIADLPFPGRDVLQDAVLQTLAANRGQCQAAARVRITLTAGRGAGIHRISGETTLLVTAEPLPPPSETAAVTVVPWVRNERSPLVGAKSTSYGEHSVILAYARARECDEALMADTQGRLCEGATCNVLVEHAGELVTPSLATGCLAGVTRDLALEWGIARELDLPIEALAAASEVLITSTTRDLLPVRSVDGRTLPAPGPLGVQAMAEFARRAALTSEP